MIRSIQNKIISGTYSEPLVTPTQPAFICSKLAIEKLEQGVEYVQSKQQRRQNDANVVI